MSKKWMFTGFAVVFWLAIFSQAGAKMPKHPKGWINDYAEILNPAVKAKLNGLAENLQQATGAQLAVVTVSSLDGLSVEDYANKLFNLWGIGQKGKDNGVLFLICHEERKARIEVGYGLEGVINDGKAGRILDESVIPYFKSGDYNQGILLGSEHIVAAITGDASTITTSEPPRQTSELSSMGWKEKLMVILFFSLFISLGFLFLGTGFRGEKFFILWGAGFGGIPLAMSLVFSWAMGFPMYILPGWALIMTLVGVFFGKGIVKHLNASGGHGSGSSSWTSGGSFSSGFGGGSSSGGFGGGSSGGGGSSRSW